MIYFDNAATTPPFTSTGGLFLGNPSSPHGLGIEAERALRVANSGLAAILGCDPSEIIYTSGGTESNNLAILGITRRLKHRAAHIITTPYEHPSVSQPLAHIREAGIHVTYAPPSDWPSLIQSDTVMVSFIHVNNETGDIHDVADIAARVKAVNPRILVHVDGVQGFCKEAVSLSQVDLYSFSAHKCHGPVGIGGLMVKRGVSLVPLMYGGGQQGGMRPGTENTAGILAMNEAAQVMWCNREKNHTHVSAIHLMVSGLERELPDTYINRQSDVFSPYVLSMSFMGIKGETLVHALSEQGIYISMGAACRARKRNTSPLKAWGYDDARAESAVRFSFSHMNTKAEAETVVSVVVDHVRRLRRLHPPRRR